MDLFVSFSVFIFTVVAIHETNQCNYKPAALLLFGAAILCFGYYGF